MLGPPRLKELARKADACGTLRADVGSRRHIIVTNSESAVAHTLFNFVALRVPIISFPISTDCINLHADAIAGFSE